MARNPEETRVVQLGAGLISSGTAVTASAQVEYPNNAWLIINVLAAGTSWAVTLSTGAASATGLTGVTIAGAARVSGTSAGIFAYHLNDKIAKWCYSNVSGVGTPTVGVQLVCQGYANSYEVPTATAVVSPTEG